MVVDYLFPAVWKKLFQIGHISNLSSLVIGSAVLYTCISKYSLVHCMLAYLFLTLLIFKIAWGK